MPPGGVVNVRKARVLWSETTVTWAPQSQKSNFLSPHIIGNASLSIVDQRVCVGENLWLAEAVGCSEPPSACWDRQAPAANADPSLCKQLAGRVWCRQSYRFTKCYFECRERVFPSLCPQNPVWDSFPGQFISAPQRSCSHSCGNTVIAT